jgi:hypothetical protein
MRGRIFGAGLGVLFAACFDKPERPGGDGGVSNFSCTEQTFTDFAGSGSGSDTCPNGASSTSGGGYLSHNNKLIAAAGGSTGEAACAWGAFAFGNGVGISVSTLLGPTANDATILALKDVASSETCSIMVAQPGMAEVTDGVSISLRVVEPQQSAAYLRLRPSGTNLVGDYSVDGITWSTVGPCNFATIPSTLTLTVGITYPGGHAGEVADINSVWTCH